MATNTFLKCDPIKGESSDAGHDQWVEVFSYSHGLSQPISGTSGTGGLLGARADFHPFVITKSADTASIDFNMYCAQGKQIDKVELEVCQTAGNKQVCYVKYELEKVVVQSVSVNGGGSDRPSETVVFAYNTISWTYTQIKNGVDDTTTGPKKWNLEFNTEG